MKESKADEFSLIFFSLFPSLFNNLISNKNDVSQTRASSLHASPAWQPHQHVLPLSYHVLPSLDPTPITPSLYNPLRLNAYTLISWKHTSYHRQIITVRFNINTDMAEHYQPLQQTQLQSRQPRSHQVVKAATAVTAGGSLLVLSGLTMAGTVIALTIATPLLVICSPVLVPAVITVSLLIMGFLASGGFGVAAISVLSWIYRYWI